jgi:serine/threonine-protein kinase
VTNEDTFAPGTLLAGKFRVIRRLGEGGMGSVYEIEHELTKHRRALKMLHAAMAAMPSIVERFLREASAAGRVGNPHIAETFDAGVLATGEPYLVMELLRGEPLSARVARGPMPCTRSSI